MSNKEKRASKVKGFTLIEVIIAVSIVVILASLVVPKVAGYIDKAKEAKILNSGKQIYAAALWSYSDQGNTFVAANISETINRTVGVSLAATNPVTIDATTNNVTIGFTTDNVPCNVIIDHTDNSYKVNKNGTQIFSSK